MLLLSWSEGQAVNGTRQAAMMVDRPKKQDMGNYWIVATIGVVTAAISLRWLLRPRPSATPTWDDYPSWLRETREHLIHAASGSGEAPATEVTIYLGPSIRVLPEQRAWALRAVEEEQLEWAFGHGWVKLPKGETGSATMV